MRRWLDSIGETDPAIIGDVLAHCRGDPEALRYYLGRAKELPGGDDDRRACRQCNNLGAAGVCVVAAPGGLIVARRGYAPIPGLPRRCEGYAPLPGEPDPRTGPQRWRGLTP